MHGGLFKDDNVTLISEKLTETDNRLNQVIIALKANNARDLYQDVHLCVFIVQ